jgi:hypothetical protein
MLLAEILAEKYTEPNSHLLRYLKNGGEFDQYSQWYLVCQWVEENDLLEEVSKIVGEPMTSAEDLENCEPDIYVKFPPEWKSEITEYVTDWLAANAPAELPTHHYLSARDNRLLPAQTWLVHFSDNAYDISREGFMFGMHDVSKLGLTTHYSNKSFEKSGGGYNFAFIANGRYARWAAETGKYGREAVMFQNSGVRAYHFSDEEEQIMFNGADVDPRMIILLRKTGDGWAVTTRYTIRNRDYLYSGGDFTDCVNWVINHYQTYRKKLFAR